MAASSSLTYCTFAYAGTYGHSCGATAVSVAVIPSDETTSGLYFGRRCVECVKVKGGENARVIRFEALDQSKHANLWK